MGLIANRYHWEKFNRTQYPFIRKMRITLKDAGGFRFKETHLFEKIVTAS